MDMKFSCKELTSENWNDLVKLFGDHGASGGCWCMYFREPYKEFKENKGEANRELFHQVVESGQPVGLIAYMGSDPVGWIAISPKENYPRVQKSRKLEASTTQSVWSITCFYTARKFRRNGINHFLIQEAIRYASDHRANVIEAYPIRSNKDKVQDASAYTGFLQTFLDLGFSEVADTSHSSPIVRLSL